MKCENLQFNLSLYIDGSLEDGERAIVDDHLAHCPLCRQKLDDFAALRRSLRGLATPVVPANLVANLQASMRAELAPAKAVRASYFSSAFLDFLQMRVMPYAVGTAASLAIGLSLLWAMLAAANRPASPSNEFAGRTPVRLAPAPGDTVVSINDFVAQRGLVSNESPSLNPQGALVELTKAFANSRLKEDELVVVADINGSGVAKIEEIVEPLDDQTTVYELERAMQSESSEAPFVPAFLDRRADSVRVVFKIQKVEVNAGPEAKKKKRK